MTDVWRRNPDAASSVRWSSSSMLVFLLACSGGTAADPSRVSAEDPPAGLAGWIASLPRCDAADPLPLDSRDQLAYAMDSSHAATGTLDEELYHAEQSAPDGCPSEAVSGDETVLSGDCATGDGWGFDGVWTIDTTDDGYAWTLDGVRIVETMDFEGIYAADGTVTVAGDTTDADLSLSVAGGVGSLHDGSFRWTGYHEVLPNNDEESGSATVSVDAPWGAGDYCAAWLARPSDTCSGSTFYMVLDGAVQWAVGSAEDCSGCWDHVVDGVYTGQTCGTLF
jgi:hypothetical protein